MKTKKPRKKRELYKDIPYDKKLSVYNAFYRSKDNEVTKIAKDFGLSYTLTLRIIDEFKP
jgi:hypothetical protein